MTNHLINEDELNRVLSVVQNDINNTSPAEVSECTGLSLETCRKGLLEMISRYKGEILFNQKTGLVSFSFIHPLIRRKSTSNSEKLYKIFELISGFIMVLLRSSLLILMIPIFILISLFPIVTLLIEILFYSLKNILQHFGTKKTQNKERPDFKLLIKGFNNFLFNYSKRNRIIIEKNNKGEYFRRLKYNYENNNNIDKNNDEADKSNNKKLIDILFDFTFGIPRAIYNKSDLSERTAKLISANNGFLTAGHLSELEGYSINEARDRLLDYVLKFDGELEINSEGTLYAYFPDYFNEVIEVTKESLLRYGDEIEPPFLLTGNSSNENFKIVKLMIMMVILTVTWIFTAINTEPNSAPNLVFIPDLFFDLLFVHPESLKWFIFYYGESITWFILLLPLIRLPFIKIANKKQEKINIRRKIYSVIFKKLKVSSILDYDFILSKLAINSYETFINTVICEIGGEININESGKTVVDFKGLYSEINFHNK